MPTIDILVSPNGESKLETRGFAGPACQKATKALEAALGLQQSETLTAEYHLPAVEEAGVASRADGPQ